MAFDAEAYARGIRRLNAAERERMAVRLTRARDEAERLARALRAADAGISRVLLFGSVARGDPRDERFDIDLCIDGGDLYKALDVVGDSPFSVDLVELRLLSAGMRELVEEGGIELGVRSYRGSGVE